MFLFARGEQSSQNNKDISDEDVIKVQAFVRGAVCRAKVSAMVKELIDELLAEREQEQRAAAKNRESNNEEKDDRDDASKQGDGLMEDDMQLSVHELLAKLESKASSAATSYPGPKKQNLSPPGKLKKEAYMFNGSSSTNIGSPGLDDDSSKMEPSSSHSETDEVFKEQQLRESETEQLLKDIVRVGQGGEPFCTFGDLFNDEQVTDYYEALVGTLKAAKKKNLVKYQGQILLKGISDNVVISIIETTSADDGKN